MSLELKPCPFCGSKVDFIISPIVELRNPFAKIDLACPGCGIHLKIKIKSVSLDDIDSFVEKWNMRATE